MAHFIDVVADFGADPTGATLSTTSFQNAINAAALAGGKPEIVLPPVPAGGFYHVGPLDHTLRPGVTVRGYGRRSHVRPAGGSPVNGIWWDLSGSNDTTLENFRVESDGQAEPSILFLSAAVQNQNSNVVNGFSVRKLDIDAKSDLHFYGYGHAYNTSGLADGAGGFQGRDCVWVQRKNGASVTDPSQRNAVAAFDGVNSRSIASDYVTLSTANPGTQSLLLDNMNFIDHADGCGSGTRSNNVPVVFRRAGQVHANLGSYQSLGDTGVVIWDNSEGLSFNTTVHKNTDGSGNLARFWFRLGGGLNGYLSMNTVFMSVPAQFGGFIALDQPVSGAGGVGHLNVIGPDIGANPNNCHFITNLGVGGGFNPASNWIYESFMDLLSSANNISSIGSIDAHTIIKNKGTVFLLAGATDGSHTV